ncbi:MAG: class I SAM-dependent RNA methyltransferase [Longimicrobiales bacterium]
MAKGPRPLTARAAGGAPKGVIPAVEIHGLSSEGDGVGRLADGRTVFVPWTAPGDVVSVQLTKDKKRWAKGALVSVDAPTSGRVEALCPLFTQCGGCAIQHVPYEAQLDWKGRFLTDALERIGGLRVAEPVAVHPSPQAFGYRSRVTFTVVRRKGRLYAGLREAGRPGRVVDVPECPLADPAVNDVWKGLRERLAELALPRPRQMVRVTVRKVVGGAVLLWRPRVPGGDPNAFMDIPGVLEVWAMDPSGGRLLAGAGDAREEWFGETLPVPGPAFTQVNWAGGQSLYDTLVSWMEPLAGRRVVDGYAGVSVVGRKLAALGAEVVAVEREGLAAEAAGTRAPPGFQSLVGLAEALIPKTLPADTVVLNPPRAGVQGSLLEALSESGPPQLIYVSCDPATLARDLKRLSGAYRLHRVEAFDLFPQTPHVEALVDLRRVL